MSFFNPIDPCKYVVVIEGMAPATIAANALDYFDSGVVCYVKDENPVFYPWRRIRRITRIPK